MRLLERIRSLVIQAVAVVGAVLVVVSARAQSESTVNLQPQKVSPSVWYAQGESALGSQTNKNFISNAAFIVGKTGVVVVDALGSPALAKGLIQAIAKITPLKVTHVIVTHYHADHIYGLQEFRKIGAKIIAHPAAKEYLQSDTAKHRLAASRTELSPWIDENTQLIEADTWIDKNVSLNLSGVDLLIKHAGPAHTPEDLIVFFDAEKILFAGDLVFRGRTPFIGPTADTAPWIASLKTMQDLNASVVVPGHGAAFKSAKEDVAQLHDYLTYLRAVMGKAVNDLDLFDEAYAAADWSRFEKLPLFRVANRMNAYNTYLQLIDVKKP